MLSWSFMSNCYKNELFYNCVLDVVCAGSDMFYFMCRKYWLFYVSEIVLLSIIICFTYCKFCLRLDFLHRKYYSNFISRVLSFDFIMSSNDFNILIMMILICIETCHFVKLC